MHFISTLSTRETSSIIQRDPNPLVLPPGCKLMRENFLCFRGDSLNTLSVTKNNVSFVSSKGHFNKQGGKNKSKQFRKRSLIRIKLTEQKKTSQKL